MGTGCNLSTWWEHLAFAAAFTGEKTLEREALRPPTGISPTQDILGPIFQLPLVMASGAEQPRGENNVRHDQTGKCIRKASFE